MSGLRKTLGLDRAGIERLSDFPGLKIWLRKLTSDLERSYSLQRNVVEGVTAAETPNWRIREANAADVTAGEARSVGNLITVHKTNGTKREVEAS